jgi:hypothetical protein
VNDHDHFHRVFKGNGCLDWCAKVETFCCLWIVGLLIYKIRDVWGTKVVHYPPDFTGMLHPLDGGIKEYLKWLYIKHLVQKGCV